MNPLISTTWWCHRVEVPWSWEWHPIIGVWLLLAAIAVPYATSTRRRRHLVAADRRCIGWFVAGLACLWLGSDWPLGTLGASYLASVHMLDYQLYVLGAAPMMVLGTPEWMVLTILRRIHGYRLARRLAHPLAAGALFNLTLVVSHAPITVDTLRTTPGGSFLLDMAWLVSGVVVWIPVCSRLPELRLRSAASRILYLWVAMGVVDTIPSSFLLFASFPLYRTFELAPRVYGISATSDQQFAGAIMKLGGMAVVFPITLAMFAEWYRQEESATSAVFRSTAKTARRQADEPGCTDLPPGAGSARAAQVDHRSRPGRG